MTAPEAGESRDMPVLIAGAGIAGLALALGLARRNVKVRVLERRSDLSEAGAGIQLGPNAIGVLQRLGVAARLEPSTGRPEAIEVMEGATGRQVGRLPLGSWLERRHGAPYRVAHRADLHGALLEAARETPEIELVTGFEVGGWRDTGDGIEASALDGRVAAGQLLVGADGLWSALRRGLFPEHPLTYSGKMAVRTVLPMPADGSRFARPVTGVWLGRDAHVVHYPVRDHRELAVVAIVDESVPREGWGGEIGALSVQARLVSFSAELLTFLSRASDWRAWSLFDPPPLPAWAQGRIGLIGDAAHPILPFLAQGGAMALEDAETLACLIAANAAQPERAFALLQSLRRDRVHRVQSASRENGRLFHARGLERVARGTVMRTVPGALLMRRYDWLYEWTGDVT
jgi:salicylate hydroxylase